MSDSSFCLYYSVNFFFVERGQKYCSLLARISIIKWVLIEKCASCKRTWRVLQCEKWVLNAHGNCDEWLSRNCLISCRKCTPQQPPTLPPIVLLTQPPPTPTITTITISNNRSPPRICQNRYDQCTKWADIGECDRNTQFMQTQCCLACCSKSNTCAWFCVLPLFCTAILRRNISSICVLLRKCWSYSCWLYL